MTMKVTETNQRYQLSPGDVKSLIDAEARQRLGMSGTEFISRLKVGTLPDSVAKRDIEMLVRLIDGKDV